MLPAHASEFAFVPFGVAASSGLLDAARNDCLIMTVTLSMALTPVFFLLNENVLGPWLARGVSPKFDAIDDEATRIIVAGIGRVGQILTRVLNARKIPYTALDIDANQVDVVRRFGRKACFGDVSKRELLRAAKADQACILVLAIDDVEASAGTAALVRKHFPHLAIQALELRELGVEVGTRTPFASTLEMAASTLVAAGVAPGVASDTIARVRRHDEDVLEGQCAVHRDEDRLVQTSQEAARELEGLFDSDQSDRSVIQAPGDDPLALARAWRRGLRLQEATR